MLVRLWGFCLLAMLNGPIANAMNFVPSPVFFNSPQKTKILAFLDKQFEGNIFLGTFNHQDENFKKLIDSFSDKMVDQIMIANFVKALGPYYRKNLADQKEDIPNKISSGIEEAVLKKQDALLKYFCEIMQKTTSDVEAWTYFAGVARLIAPGQAKL